MPEFEDVGKKKKGIVDIHAGILEYFHEVIGENQFCDMYKGYGIADKIFGLMRNKNFVFSNEIQEMFVFEDNYRKETKEKLA